MNIIHTSDWHLGKKLFKLSRIHEQKLFLDWINQYIKSNNIQALLISGDIFDTPMPPNDAIELYFKFLKEITESTNIHIFIIPGNHDSGHFLKGPTPFLSDHRIHITTNMQADPNNLSEHFSRIIEDDQGNQVELFLLPYFRWHQIKNLSKDIFYEEELKDLADEEVTKETLKRVFTKSRINPKVPRILLTHQHLGSYQSEGSEHFLAQSGLESLAPSFFADHFDYLALGHIHKYQTIKSSAPTAIYPGSPIPFRFSESNEKYFSKITIQRDSHSLMGLSNEKVAIPVFRKLFTIKGNTENILDKIEEIEKTKNDLSDFIEIELQGHFAPPGLIDEVKKKLIIKKCELISFKIIPPPEEEGQKDRDLILENLTTEDLFNLFLDKKEVQNDDREELKKTFFSLFNDPTTSADEADGERTSL